MGLPLPNDIVIFGCIPARIGNQLVGKPANGGLECLKIAMKHKSPDCVFPQFSMGFIYTLPLGMSNIMIPKPDLWTYFGVVSLWKLGCASQ